jgi:hypothetical protein
MLAAMKPLRVLLLAALLAVPLASRADDDDPVLGHVLTLVQTFTRIAAQSDDPQSSFDDVLAGRDRAANRAAAGLLDTMTGELPAAQRAQISAIAADLLAATRKRTRPAATPAPFPLDATQSLP